MLDSAVLAIFVLLFAEFWVDSAVLVRDSAPPRFEVFHFFILCFEIKIAIIANLF
ncbi:hypothetical protein [Helicobacter sp. 23-1045]